MASGSIARLSLIQRRLLWATVLILTHGLNLGQGVHATVSENRKLLKVNDVGASDARIVEAQTLLASGARVKAIKGLLEKAKPKNRYAKQIKEFGEVFLTEQGQNQFLFAQSNWTTLTKEAIEAVTAAEPQEDSNSLLLLLKVRSHLRLNQCEAAQAVSKQYEDVFGNEDDEAKLIELQIHACRLKKDNTAKWSQSFLKSEYQTAATLTHVKYLVGLDTSEALQLAKKILSEMNENSMVNSKAPLTAAKNTPQLLYWKWKVFREPTSAHSFVSRCAALPAAERELYGLYPDLCWGADLVAAEVKSVKKVD